MHRLRLDARSVTASLAFFTAVATLKPVVAIGSDDVVGHADDAFGSRIGTESIGLYSESLVRGFNLQQAGNYRLDDAYFVRAASPPDTLVTGSQVRVGPRALDIDFPAPSGIVQYRLLPDDHNRLGVELGFQHLLDSNPRPYLRGHFAWRPEDGNYSVAGGVIGSPSARYIFGNEARYHSAGLVSRFDLGERWRLTVLYGYYDQTYQADVGFSPAEERLPRPDRLRYPGQEWSRFDTRNTTYGSILSSRPRDGHWDYSISAIHSRVERPRSDYNLFTDVDADGFADASVSVARDRDMLSQAYEASAGRTWRRTNVRDRLTLLARLRDSSYTSPRVERHALGRVSVFEPIPQIDEPPAITGPHSRSGIDQHELGVGWQRQWRDGATVNLGLRHVALAESVEPVGGTPGQHDSRAWLYNASAVVPISTRFTAFASFIRGIEEAGVAPQHAANAFEVLPATLARQSELGMTWHAGERTALIGTMFDISKPEGGFDRDQHYSFLSDVRHRGAELSFSAEPMAGLRTLFGATWMRARLHGEAVDEGLVGKRPVGRSERLLMASLDYRPRAASAWSFDVDATYSGPRPADGLNQTYTPGYAVVNAGLRYRLPIAGIPATLRLRAHNLADRYAWHANSSGMQAWEPERRVMLSLALGE